MPGPHRLRSITLDPTTLTAGSPEIEHERQVAIFDLVEENDFRPVGAGGGPYDLVLACEESRLSLQVTGPNYQKAHMLSLTPLRGVLKDYFMICESYAAAVRGAGPSQIEALDMGRRGLHNEGAALLQERLSGKIEMDQETSRRMFTLVGALQRRA